MPIYRVISLDITTGARIAEIPLRDLHYGWTLVNGIVVGYVTGKLQLPELRRTDPNRTEPLLTDTGEVITDSTGQPLLVPVDDTTEIAGAVERARVLNDAVDEARRHLFVERDGVVVGDGIVWKSPYSPATRIRAVDAWSTVTYLDRRRIRSDHDFVGVDQFTIARTLITTELARPGGNIGITVGAETSGVLRDRHQYRTWEVKNLGEALEQLASVENGFDLSIDCSWDPATGSPIKLLRLHYPRRGRSFAQSGHVFEYGRNMTFDWPSTAEKMANQIHGIGDGTEVDTLIATVTDAESLAAGYPLLEDEYSNKSVTWRPTLIDQARAKLLAQRQPTVLPKLVVRADKDPTLGSYLAGDAALVSVPAGHEPRFPDGLNEPRQIVAYDVGVSDEGEETITVTTGEEPI